MIPCIWLPVCLSVCQQDYTITSVQTTVKNTEELSGEH